MIAFTRQDYERKVAALEFAIEAIIRDSVFSVAGKAEALEVLYDDLGDCRAVISTFEDEPEGAK